jgi:hypothetical protein
VRILHLSNTPLSRAPLNIAECQAHLGHSTQVLLSKDTTPSGLRMHGGDLWPHMTRRAVTELFEAADIIHLHNFAWEQSLFKVHPHLKEITLSKKYLIQYHSDRRAKESFETTINDPAFRGRKAVLAQYHANQYPEAEHLVGNPLPLFKPPFSNTPRPRSPLISFAPSNTHIMRGYDYKGADKVVPILKDVRAHTTCEYDVITGVGYETCLSRKSFATVGIEELVSGSYHLSFLEYMAFGCATMGNLSDTVMSTLSRYVGEAGVTELQNSFIQTDVRNLQLYLVRLVKDADYLAEMQARARNWIFNHWSVESHVRAFDRVYSSL